MAKKSASGKSHQLSDYLGGRAVGEIFHLASFEPLKDGRTVGEIFNLATFGPFWSGRAVGKIFHLATFGPLWMVGQLA